MAAVDSQSSNSPGGGGLKQRVKLDDGEPGKGASITSEMRTGLNDEGKESNEPEAKEGKSSGMGLPMPTAEQTNEYLQLVLNALEKGWPMLLDAYDNLDIYYKKLLELEKQHAHPELRNIIMGLSLVFYGGQFQYLVAVVTAMNLTGLNQLKTAFRQIRNQFEAAKEAMKDPKMVQALDEDGDGELQFQELQKGLKRMAHGDMKAIAAMSPFLNKVDPSEVMTAIGSCWALLLTVLATLRSQFAKSVSLGVNVGEILSKNFSQYIVPAIGKSLPDGQKKWAKWAVEFACKGIGVFMALWLQKMVSAFHSALQGGAIVASSIFVILNEQGLWKHELSLDEPKEEIALQWCIAIYGWYWQVSSGFKIMLLLKPFLAPFLMAESILSILAVY